jgi:hypothetical protein
LLAVGPPDRVNVVTVAVPNSRVPRDAVIVQAPRTNAPAGRVASVSSRMPVAEGSDGVVRDLELSERCGEGQAGGVCRAGEDTPVVERQGVLRFRLRGGSGWWWRGRLGSGATNVGWAGDERFWLAVSESWPAALPPQATTRALG